jgi:hypothetical protein
VKKKQAPLLVHAQRSFNSIPMAPMLLILFLHLSSFTEAAEDFPTYENPLQRMSRNDLARIAGYGEERLSSVLVIGTLDCGVCLAPGPRLLSIHVSGLTEMTLFLNLLHFFSLLPGSWISFSYKVYVHIYLCLELFSSTSVYRPL